MSLLSPPPEPSNKYKALTYTGVALCVALAIVLYFAFRYYPEKRAAEHFFGALVSGHEKQAYELWKPSASYKIGDFLADWGPEGYYGPVKSYEVMRARQCKRSNGVTVSVAVSPFSPMPGMNEQEKSRRTKVIPLFVDATKAMSFFSCPDDE